MPDDALDDLEVPETPKLKVLLEIDQRFADVVRIPVPFAFAIDANEHGDELGAEGMRLAQIAFEQSAWHGMPEAVEPAQEGIVEGRRLEGLAQPRLSARIVSEDLEHRLVLVAEEELEEPVLQGLKAGSGAEHVAKLHVLRRRERFEHRPHLEKLPLHLLDPRQRLGGGARQIAVQPRDRRLEFMQDQLEP